VDTEDDVEQRLEAWAPRSSRNHAWSRGPSTRFRARTRAGACDRRACPRSARMSGHRQRSQRPTRTSHHWPKQQGHPDREPSPLRSPQTLLHGQVMVGGWVDSSFCSALCRIRPYIGATSAVSDRREASTEWSI
jgi:hypothetical protein